jgi:hypothetical protein
MMVLPTRGQADDFAATRLDPIIESSAYLRGRMHPIPPRRKGPDSRRVKRIGAGQIVLRGAQTRGEISSYATDLLVLDEYDQMPAGTLALAEKRLTSSRAGRLVVFSTPTFPETGIHALYLTGDQRIWQVTCGGCNLEQSLEWSAFDRDARVFRCRRCREALDRLGPGRWVAQAPEYNAVHSYRLQRFYLPWWDIAAMIAASEETSLAGVREFANSDLGEPFVEPGVGLTIADVAAAATNYDLEEYRGEPTVMGVDVGMPLYVVVRGHPYLSRNYFERRRTSTMPLWFAGSVRTFEELEPLLIKYHVRDCVIDEQPETHKASEFARAHDGTVWLGHYGRQRPSHDWQEASHRSPGRCVINRSEAVEAAFDRIRAGRRPLPRRWQDLGGKVRNGIGEYARQVTALQRTVKEDEDGNPVYRWVKIRRDDHYAHAEILCNLAPDSPGAYLLPSVAL